MSERPTARPWWPANLAVGAASRTVSVVAMVGAVLYPCLRAIAAGWWPLEDDARTAVRVQDLLQGHLPTIGAQASTGLLGPSAAAHHLGPVEFYLLAPFVALDTRAGVVAGMAAIHLVAVVLIARAAWLLGGARLLAPVAVGTILLAEGTTYARLFQPVNTMPPLYYLVLGILSAVLVLQRRPGWIPLLVLSVSIPAQGQLAYVPYAAAVAGIVGLVGLSDWRGNRGTIWPIPGWPRRSAPRWRPGWIGTGLAVLLWLPPLYESLTFRPGNASQLWRYVTLSRTTPREGTRPSLTHYLAYLAPVPGLGEPVRAVLAIALVGALGFLVAATARRVRPEPRLPPWRSSVILLPSAAALAAVGESVLLATLVPSGPGVWTTVYWETPLHAACVLVWASTAWLVVRWVRMLLNRRLRAPWNPLGLVATVLAVTVAALIALPASASVNLAKNRVVIAPSALALAALPTAVTAGGTVRVMYTGGFFFTPVYPTAYRLMGAGYFVCNDFTWSVPEQTDFRAWTACPADSPVVVISRKNAAPELQPPLTAGTLRLLGSTDTYPEGQESVGYDVYLLTFGPVRSAT